MRWKKLRESNWEQNTSVGLELRYESIWMYAAKIDAPVRISIVYGSLSAAAAAFVFINGWRLISELSYERSSIHQQAWVDIYSHPDRFFKRDEVILLDEVDVVLGIL